MNKTEETVSCDFEFVSDDLRLSGTIEKPSRMTPRGSILLLSGSGPQDRDETIAGHKPFCVLSQALASSGFLVYRWDDRGVGESEGDYLLSSAEHLVGDVVEAMSAIRRETGLEKHVLIGHSQGTLIAASVAARVPSQVDGLILLAGMSVHGRVGLLDQHVLICQAEGWSDDDIRTSLAQKEALFDMLTDTQAEIDAGIPEKVALLNLRTNLYDAFLGEVDISEIPESDRFALESTIEDLLEWECRYLLAVDPTADLSNLKCPVLAIWGGQDSQVDAKRNLEVSESACKRGGVPEIEVHVVPDHNHLFQKTASAALSDYESLGTPFDDDLLDIVRSWLSRNETKQDSSGL